MGGTFYDFIKNHSTEARIAFPEDVIKKVTKKDCDKKTTIFLRDVFIRIGKETVWEFDDLKTETISKTFHSLILYYLGIATKDYFIKHFENVVKELPDVDCCGKKDIYWFEYIWRLTSFYHDVMTKYEKDERKITSEYIPYVFCPMMTVENFLNSCHKLHFGGIQFTIFKDDLQVKAITNDLKVNDCTFGRNAEDIVNRYFRKRLFSRNLDHGIISGYVFYNQLAKNYLLKSYQVSNKEADGSFKDGSLNYRPVHLVLFKYIADAIISHNIWFYNDYTKYEYIPWGLEKLSHRNRISLKKNPLAFILGLLDTIEPTKFFNTIKSCDVLLSIDIECCELDDGHLKMVLSKPTDSDTIDFDDWYEHKLKDMECWLDLTVEYNHGTKEIKITIPS